MCLYEWYFNTLKDYVRNMAKPEGCMAKGYEVQEACGFVSEYFGKGQPYMKKVWESKEDPSLIDVVLEGKEKDRFLDDVLRKQIHGFVLDNAVPSPAESKCHHYYNPLCYLRFDLHGY